MRTNKIWLGVGASVLLTSFGPSANAAATLPNLASKADAANDVTSAIEGRAAGQLWLVAGGEGGEGGEAGIDAETAASDPLGWNIALGVIAAHCLAGQQAYDAGETTAGAEMFAHGHSEVYAELESAFDKRGLSQLGTELLAAIELSSQGADSKIVGQHVDNVLSLLETAIQKGPEGSAKLETQARALADLIDRTATQFSAANAQAEYEPYLDGLGFRLAAEAKAQSILPRLRKSYPDTAQAIDAGLAVAKKAFPSAVRPTNSSVDPGAFLASASRVKLSLPAIP